MAACSGQQARPVRHNPTPTPIWSGPAPTPSQAPAPPSKTLTHWATAGDFKALKDAGYYGSIVELSPSDRGSWQQTLDAAASADFKLIPTLYPYPYRRNSDGSWLIQQAGVDFLKTLQARKDVVMAVFVFNEPYFTDPSTGKSNDCGSLSAADLRTLRAQIKTIWPEALIYHDLDDPTTWAPGGEYWQSKASCIGDKYKDQTEVADYAGIWDYPFRTDKGYTKDASLASLRRQIDFVKKSMAPAQPVALAQGFASKSERFYFPSHDEIKDWNCTIRGTGVEYVSWYPWKQPGRYDDVLANHGGDLPVTLASACGP
jgi:hypothetical protein